MMQRRGHHYKEQGFTPMDRTARREGEAIAVLNRSRVHVPHASKGILWNTSVVRLQVRESIEDQTQARRVRRMLGGFFSKYSLRTCDLFRTN